jgi:putative ABC transport system permease protein
MTPGELWRRVYYLLNRSRLEHELADEMAVHRAMKSAGEPPFGKVLRLREEAGDVWGWRWWDYLVHDVAFGVRILRKSPAFTLTAIIVLGFGVGINLAAFQVFNTLAWRPLPVKDPDSLVRFSRRTQRFVTSSFSYPVFRFYAEHNTVLAASMAVVHTSVSLGDDASSDLPIQFVTANYLTELGTVPAIGRLLVPSDGAPDATPVVVLSHPLWETRFGSDPSIVGRLVRINGQSITVAGVASASFVGLTPRVPQAWMPIEKHAAVFSGSDLLTNVGRAGVVFFARLKPGLSANAAEDGMKSAVAAARELGSDPAWDGEWLEAEPAGRFTTLDGKRAAGVLIAAAFAVILLLASCTNLAMLILARGLSRSHEISIRLSVGATRPRIVRQLLTESALLSIVGTGVGLGVSVVVARMVLSFADAPRFLQPHFDIRVITYSFVMAALAAGLFGIVPALQAVRLKAAPARTRSILVAVQVAAGCTLLVVGGLLVRAFQHVMTEPPGFEFAEHIIVDPHLQANSFTPAAADQYWTELRAALERIRGVASMSLASLPPLGERIMSDRAGSGAVAFIHHIDPTYFEVMGVPLLRGRNLASRERGVVLVSDSLASAIWPGEDPLGKTYLDKTVVGVVGNARTVTLGDSSITEAYLPMDDARRAWAVLIVRVHGDPARALPTIVAATKAIDSRVSPSFALVRDRFDQRIQSARQLALIVSTLGMIALSLAAIGLAGLLSFSVSQRVREIGIRMALGARPLHVAWTVMRQFGLPIGFGLVAGLTGAASLSSLLRSQLFGLSHLDPASYAAAAILFTIVALLAAAGPVRSAIHVNPITALRCE